MKELLHPRPGQRRTQPGGLSHLDAALLVGQDELLARLDANVTEFYPHRRQHVQAVALVVLKARP